MLRIKWALVNHHTCPCQSKRDSFDLPLCPRYPPSPGLKSSVRLNMSHCNGKRTERYSESNSISLLSPFQSDFTFSWPWQCSLSVKWNEIARAPGIQANQQGAKHPCALGKFLFSFRLQRFLRFIRKDSVLWQAETAAWITTHYPAVPLHRLGQ